MSNKIIPLRRIQRRRQLKKRWEQLMDAVRLLQKLNERYRTSPTAIHFPSGGVIARRNDIIDFSGYLKKIQDAAASAELYHPVDQGQFVLKNDDTSPIMTREEEAEYISLLHQGWAEITPKLP